MKLEAIILLILVSYTFSDACVIYTFEEGYPDSFAQSGWCSRLMHFWDLGSYNDTAVTGHSTLSTKFVSPLSARSCVSSFMFPMEQGGTVEVNIFMETSSTADSVEVRVMGWDERGVSYTVGVANNSPFRPSTFVTWWHTLRVTLAGSGAYNGFINFLGSIEPPAIALVDSFRYMPPGMDESECPIYLSESTTPTETTLESESTTAMTTESTTEWSTEVTVEPTTTDDFTLKNELTTFPPTSEDPEDTLWTPQRLTLLALLSILIIVILCCSCYRCQSKPTVIIVKA